MLLVVGSVALDSVETPFGAREDALGGSATYFAAAASLLAPVHVVGVVGDDFPLAQLEFLRARGVHLDLLERVPGRTFRWKGRYGYDLNAAQTLDTQLNVFENFEPRLDARARRSDRVFLGNIDPELQLRVLDQMERPRLVCADTMNYWISSKRAQLLALLPRIDVLLVNDAEARQLSGESNVIKAAAAIERMGARAVCIKRGEYGALLVSGSEAFFAPAYPLANVVDPTGAGDSFAGGFIGLLDRTGGFDLAALCQAVVMGCTIASFTVEAFCVDRFVCLGDTVGYGANPNEACDLVRARCEFAMLGNHDAAVAGRMDYSYYYAAAREVLDWTALHLSPENMAWLRTLPYTKQEGKVLWGHASPRDPAAFEYVFALEQAEDLVLRTPGDLPHLTFIGHSHLQRAFQLLPLVKDVFDERLRIEDGNKYLCSIGSCGQPRDYDPRACYGIWDDADKVVEFRRVTYDAEKTARKILEAGLSHHFARRLLHGV